MLLPDLRALSVGAIVPRVFDWGAGTGGWSCFALLLQSVAGCLGVAVVLALVVAWGGTVRERFFFFFFFFCAIYKD